MWQFNDDLRVVVVVSAGTLTQNKLSLSDPILFSNLTGPQLVFQAALASKRAEGHHDAIDFCVTKAVSESDRWVVVWRACEHS